jgi:hypothetical protein
METPQQPSRGDVQPRRQKHCHLPHGRESLAWSIRLWLLESDVGFRSPKPLSIRAMESYPRGSAAAKGLARGRSETIARSLDDGRNPFQKRKTRHLGGTSVAQRDRLDSASPTQPSETHQACAQQREGARFRHADYSTIDCDVPDFDSGRIAVRGKPVQRECQVVQRAGA